MLGIPRIAQIASVMFVLAFLTPAQARSLSDSAGINTLRDITAQCAHYTRMAALLKRPPDSHLVQLCAALEKELERREVDELESALRRSVYDLFGEESVR